MNKSLLGIFFVAIGGGILGSFLFFSIMTGNYSILTGNFSQTKEETESATLLPSPSPIPGMWERLISDSSYRSVAIQVFKDNKVIRQGGGIVVSSDGLVVTVADFLSANAVYQIFYEDQILKGSVVAWDFKSNLLLLKTSSSFSGIADLAVFSSYQTGEETTLIGRLVFFSKPIIVSQRATVSYSTDRVTIFDTTANHYLQGFQIINSSGNLLGISTLKNGKINLIKASIISDFLKDHIKGY